MRIFKKFFLTVLSSSILLVNGCGGGSSNQANNQNMIQVTEDGTTQLNPSNAQKTINDLPVEPLSEDERNGLLFTREEEKLAYDVYITLYGYDYAQLNIFNNIAQAEQTHTDSVKVLLDKYELQDPVSQPAVIGVFENPTLQTLYDQLVNEGSDLISALQVGAKIEELDINDIQTELLTTDNQDIQLLYENLLKGSRNHLRAFYSTLQKNGGDYTPVYISQEAFNAIVNSDMER